MSDDEKPPEAPAPPVGMLLSADRIFEELRAICTGSVEVLMEELGVIPRAFLVAAELGGFTVAHGGAIGPAGGPQPKISRQMAESLLASFREMLGAITEEEAAPLESDAPTESPAAKKGPAN